MKTYKHQPRSHAAAWKNRSMVYRAASVGAGAASAWLRAPRDAQRTFAEYRDAIQRSADATIVSGGASALQRKPSETGTRTGGADVSATVTSATAAGGTSLPTPVRHFFEPRFGADFSDVRVHTGAAATASARALDARAYTHARDIVFGAGEYAPDTYSGRRLIAHELAHTVQQSGAAAPRVQRTPRVANMDWVVSHGDVAAGNAVDLLTVAIRELGVPAADARTQATAASGRSQWAAKRDLYVRAFDFLRDNRNRFGVPNPLDLVTRALDYCDASTASATALTDAFYTGLLTTTVYSAGSGSASFTHTSGTVYDVPGRASGSTDFAPTGTDALTRPNPDRGRAGAVPGRTVTGGFTAGTDLLVAYGGQQGTVAASSVTLMLDTYSARVPARLRPFLEPLATDPTIFSVLQRFLHDDRGGFHLQSVGYGGAHYTPGRPPSIEVDTDIFPGSRARREMTEIGVRTTMAHELFHYALDRADAQITEVGNDHDFIPVMEDRVTIVALLRAGQSPVNDEVHALNGFAGGAPRPALTRLIAANDHAGLRSFVQTQDFLDATVYTMLVTPVSGIAARVAGTFGHISDTLMDPAQITDLAYLAAINGVILRKAFELAADVAARTRTPLASVWSHADFQRDVRAFILRYIGLASQNRSQGAVALAATI
ncbi:MAG: DUF4157 domain-containing protein [Sulfurifustis sp.]